jgi:carboxypeptidase A2
LLAAAAVSAQYEGHQLLTVYPRHEADSRLLRDLMFQDTELDFWTEPSRVAAPVDVRVPPARLDAFLAAVDGMSVNVREANLQTLVSEEKARLASRSRSSRMAVELDDFNTFSDIELWLQGDLLDQCAEKGRTCQLVSAGPSHEGRDLWVFSLSSGPAAGGGDKPVFWLDATIHAREWLAPATLIKIMDRMVNYDDEDVVAMLDKYDFFFMPVMNPDGYDYTWTNQRLWRKNRRPVGNGCFGADLNRNFGYSQWGREGVSDNPCSDLYCGPEGASEPETQAVQSEAARLAPRTIPAWVTIHSYGRMWMHPWGHTVDNAGRTCQRATDHDEMFRVADLTADAIQSVYGPRWDRGTSCEVIYETTGGTDDYVKEVHGVAHPICPELRGNGFIIAASEIEPSYREIFAGLVTFVQNI